MSSYRKSKIGGNDGGGRGDGCVVEKLLVGRGVVRNPSLQFCSSSTISSNLVDTLTDSSKVLSYPGDWMGEGLERCVGRVGEGVTSWGIGRVEGEVGGGWK